MDIDIDCSPKLDKSIFGFVKASMVKDGTLVPHPCGQYPQNVPIDPFTNLCAIPYKEAEELHYLKIDFLNVHVYTEFEDRAEIDSLLKIEPDWNLLLVPSNHAKLFQLSNSGELLMQLKPKSIQDLADVLALIRPGKKHLLELYKKNKIQARKLLWSKDTDSYYFKLAHALSYAHIIVLQLHLIDQNRI